MWATKCPEVRPAETGELTFDSELPADQNGEYTITATLSPEDGDPVSETITVSVRTLGCTVSVTPQPLGVGCDLGASADEDPDTPGMQTTIQHRQIVQM